MQIYTLQLSAGMRYCFLGGQHISMGSALFKFPETFSLYKNDIKRHHKSVFSNMAAFFMPQVYSFYNNPRKQDIMLIIFLTSESAITRVIKYITCENCYTQLYVLYTVYIMRLVFFFQSKRNCPLLVIRKISLFRKGNLSSSLIHYMDTYQSMSLFLLANRKWGYYSYLFTSLNLSPVSPCKYWPIIDYASGSYSGSSASQTPNEKSYFNSLNSI